MKDLYRRVGLQPYESSRNKILACKGDYQDTEAACSILLDGEKKAEYDRVYTTLRIITAARQRLGVRTGTKWRRTHGDFYPEGIEADTQTRNPPNKSQPVSWFNSRTMKWSALAAAIVIPAVLGLTWLSDTVVSEDEKPNTIIYKQVLEPAITVFEEPDNQARELGELKRFDRAPVVVEKSTAEWDFVQTNTISGYVWNEALNIGNQEYDHIENCRSQGITRFSENMPLLSLQQGTHHLTVINPLLDDAVFKLRNKSGVDVLAYYIRGNQTVTIDDVPDGNFQFRYAVGKNYSENCGRFLDGMRAMKDDTYREFSSNLWAGKKEEVNVHYVLDSPSHRFEPIPPRLF